MQYINDISDLTRQKRNQIKSLQDEFMTFAWGGVDAFENFGAFIINDKKGSLKFYNGPSFSNEYTKPQFDQAGGTLQGVTFNKQTISFTIGVYWISIEHYRKLINWLHPLKTDYLQFGFDKNFRYDVKLSKCADSTRWIVGKENGEPRYYTELQLTFDVQGTPCAKGMYSYEFVNPNNTTSKMWSFTADAATKKVSGVCQLNKETSEFIVSDLETPVQVHFSLTLHSDYLETNYFYNYSSLEVLGQFGTGDQSQTVILESEFDDDTTAAEFDDDDVILTSKVNNNPAEYDIRLIARHSYIETKENGEEEEHTEDLSLCSFVLQHLALFVDKEINLNFTYFSETGLVFLKTTDQSLGSILTLQTFTDSGEFLVKSLQSSKFMLPGAFDYSDFYNSNHSLQFVLQYSKKTLNGTQWVSSIINPTCYENQVTLIECYPRTNLI